MLTGIWNEENSRKLSVMQSVGSAGEVEVEVIGVLVLDGAACLSGRLWVDAFSLDFSCLNWNVWSGPVCCDVPPSHPREQLGLV